MMLIAAPGNMYQMVSENSEAAKAWVTSLARVREYTITIVYYDGTRSVYNVRAYSAEDADYQAPRNVVGKKITCRTVEPRPYKR